MTRSIDVAQFREKLVALTALFKQGKLQECRVQPNTANLLGATNAALGKLDKAIASYAMLLPIILSHPLTIRSQMHSSPAAADVRGRYRDEACKCRP
jgi:hypothetical protein